MAHLSRKPQPNPRAAAAALGRAREAGLDTATLHHDLGLAQLLAGMIDEAIVSLKAAVAKDPDYASAYHYLAMAHREKEEPKEVRKCLLKALEIDPERAASWHALGDLDVATGNPGQAVASFRRAVRLDPSDTAAYEGLGAALRAAGREGEARQAARIGERIGRGAFAPASDMPPKPRSVAEFEQRLKPDADAELLHIALSTKLGLLPPGQLRPDHVAHLFDKYADRFDKHLQENLGYRIPEQLAEAVAVVRGVDTRPMDVFDLGCGTGLCGPFLRPMAATLHGVDLSPAMIEKARARGVYDELVVGDLVEALKARPRAFDLLTAADVMIYLGDLAPVMEAAATALRPGGLLAFSVEAGGGDRYYLQQPIRRYAHSKPYLEHVARIFGFEQRSFGPVMIRYEKKEPVAGYLVVLEGSA
jgi:predicted TPR repeat methyltransferase